MQLCIYNMHIIDQIMQKIWFYSIENEPNRVIIADNSQFEL